MWRSGLSSTDEILCNFATCKIFPQIKTGKSETETKKVLHRLFDKSGQQMEEWDILGLILSSVLF